MRASHIAGGVAATLLIAAVLSGFGADPAPPPAASSITVVRGAAPVATPRPPSPAPPVSAPVPSAVAEPAIGEPMPVDEDEMPTDGEQDVVAAHPGAAVP